MVARVRRGFLLGVLAAGAAFAFACGSADESAGFASLDGGSTNDSGADGAFTPSTDAGAAGPAVDAVFLVHAAAFPAYRICFEGLGTEQPFPSKDVMPEANVVGVDVGSVVRLPPLGSSVGRVFLYKESDIRYLYAPASAPGPDCKHLATSPSPPPFVTLDALGADLSSGVHVLALTGCQAAGLDAAANKARCGDTWTAGKGNLALTHLQLLAQARFDKKELPVQALQLSNALEGEAAGRAIGISFGTLASAPTPPFADDLQLGHPAPGAAEPLAFDAADASAYADEGFFLSLGAPADGGVDGGARQVLVTQSLAATQRLSDPTALPTDWYGGASSYVLLVVGEPKPMLPDGGPDGDERRALHLLSVPIAPLASDDAGAL
jgi:hypothetical protein